MDRSLAGRPAIGRPLGSTAPRRTPRAWTPRSGARSSDADERNRRLDVALLAALAREAWASIWRRRRLRIALLAALAALALLAGGWLLLRDSSLVSVEHVHVSGVHGPDAAAIEAALGRAARDMTTLDVHSGALLSAVAPYRVVREVHATAAFPHGLQIRVVEQLPVAGVLIAGERTAVAADGVILGPALLSGSLPTVSSGTDGLAIAPRPGQLVHGSSLLASLAVLGAAPAPLASAVARVYNGPEGVTVAMHSGLLVYFGDATRPHAKWLSLARVLADPSSAGASTVDVRLPERPAAGLGTVRTEASSGEGEPTSSAEPTTAAQLGAALTAALGGGSSPGVATSPIPTREAPAEAKSGVAAETGSSVPAEPNATPTTQTPPASTAEPASSTPTTGG